MELGGGDSAEMVAEMAGMEEVERDPGAAKEGGAWVASGAQVGALVA